MSQPMQRWDVYYLGDRVAQGTEAPTAARACADYLKFAAEFGDRLKLDYLHAKPHDAGFVELKEA